MIRVLHIVPALGIGGVEIGIANSRSALMREFDYQVFSLKGEGAAHIPTLSRTQVIQHVLSLRDRPDVIVSSLWPAHPLGWSGQLLGIRWLPFFHAAGREGGKRDRILAWAARQSRIRLCDSRATVRYFGFPEDTTIVCPFLFDRQASRLPAPANPKYAVVVCGRLSPEKRPDLILRFLERMQQQWPEARSLLLLSGDVEAFHQFAAEAAMRAPKATLLHNVPHKDITGHMHSAAFYLNLSDYEGFSATTVEALGSGCVPIVRPVGEIPNYLPADCGVYVDYLEDSGFSTKIDTCRRLMPDIIRRNAMVEKACRTLDTYEDYVTAFSRAVRSTLALG